MKLDRALIKSQAKEIIKNQILNLFLVSIVVSILVGGVNIVINAYDGASNESISSFDDIFGNDNDKSYFDNFTDDGKPNIHYFDNFKGSLSLVTTPKFNKNKLVNSTKNIIDIVTLILAPLSISLCGLYIMVIRGNKMKLGECFNYVFSKTFSENYFHKLVLTVIKPIIIGLLTCLFIIPGVIAYYKYYFAEMIMAEHSGIGARDALRLSKDMTRGHKGELFALSLSFIGNLLLVPLTLGIYSIYLIPYINTTKALYYENFRIRCQQESLNPQLKFMTEEEKLEFFNNLQQEEQTVVVEEPLPPQDAYGSGMDTNYYNGNF